MNSRKIKLSEVLKQEKDFFEIQDNEEYTQVTVSNTGEIKLRSIKKGLEIGTKKQYKIKAGEFIYSRLGIHQGSFGIVPESLNGAIVTGDMPVFKIDDKKILPKILIFLLKQKEVRDIFDDLTRGLAQSRIREKYLLDIEIPDLTIGGQKEILDKIKSMENEIKQLEENFQKDETLLIKLKQSILQEAVQGKLVKQNPKDEPASELLKKIKKEKDKLIKEGKIKKGKELPKIEEDEIPYKLQKGWVWCKLGEVASYKKGFAFKSMDYCDSGKMITKIKNLTENNTRNSVYMEIRKSKEYKEYLLSEGDIVLTTVGSSPSSPLSVVGTSFLINVMFSNSLLNQNAVRIRPLKIINNSFLYFILNSMGFKQHVIKEEQGTANQSSITQKSIKEFVIGLPPLSEQKRIVAKVDELMKFCDRLEEQIKGNKKNSELLMSAVLRESFE